MVLEKRREYEGKSRDHAHRKDGACKGHAVDLLKEV